MPAPNHTQRSLAALRQYAETPANWQLLGAPPPAEDGPHVFNDGRYRVTFMFTVSNGVVVRHLRLVARNNALDNHTPQAAVQRMALALGFTGAMHTWHIALDANSGDVVVLQAINAKVVQP